MLHVYGLSLFLGSSPDGLRVGEGYSRLGDCSSSRAYSFLGSCAILATGISGNRIGDRCFQAILSQGP